MNSLSGGMQYILSSLIVFFTIGSFASDIIKKHPERVKMIVPSRSVLVLYEDSDKKIPDWVFKLGNFLYNSGFDPVAKKFSLTKPFQESLEEYIGIIMEVNLSQKDSMPKLSISNIKKKRFILYDTSGNFHTSKIVNFSNAQGEKINALVIPQNFFSANGDSELIVKWILQAKDVRERFLILIDPHTRVGQGLLENLYHILKLQKLKIDVAHIKDFDRFHEKKLKEYHSIIIGDYAVWEITSNKSAFLKINNFIQDGGNLVSLVNFKDEKLNEMFGIESLSKNIIECKGITFEDEFLPGAKDIEVTGAEFGSSSYEVKLKKEVSVIARSRTPTNSNNKGVPLLWIYKTKKGRNIYWNDSSVSRKEMRGLLLHTILKSADAEAYPIINAGVIYIDDCPCPMTNIKKEPILSEFNMTDIEFYFNPWLLDIKKSAQEFGIKFTAAAVFSYDDKVKEPFDIKIFKTAFNGASLEFSRLISEAGFEIALHGYNHQSLSIRESKLTKGWESKEQMILALKIVREEWHEIFGNNVPMPKVYVAPNNLISRMGKEAVKAAFPEIEGIASQYLNEGEIEGQEFDFDPIHKGVVNLPRISSGYYMGNINSLAIINGLSFYGVFSHFIHPDEVYDHVVSLGMNWSELKIKFYEMLSFIKKYYPFLRYMFASEFVEEIKNYRTMKFETVRERDRIKISAFRKDRKEVWFAVSYTDINKFPYCIFGCREVFRNPLTGIVYFVTTDTNAEIILRKIENE